LLLKLAVLSCCVSCRREDMRFLVQGTFSVTAFFCSLLIEVHAATLVQQQCKYEAIRNGLNGTGLFATMFDDFSRAPIFDPTLRTSTVEVMPIDTANLRLKRSMKLKIQNTVRKSDSTVNVRRRRFINFVPPENTTPSPSTASRTPQQRSLCSWRTSLDVDVTRYPRNIKKAECNHVSGDNSCNFSFSYVFRQFPGIIERLKLETECEIVYGQIEVIRECCDRGVYSQQTEWTAWPVGCACAEKNIRNVTPTGPLRNRRRA